MATGYPDQFTDLYSKEVRKLFHQRLSYLLIIAALLFWLYVPLDYLLNPALFSEFILYRMIFVLFYGLLFYLNRKDSRYRHARILSCGLYWFSLILVAVMVHRTGGLQSPDFNGFIIVIVLFAGLMPLNMQEALACGISAIGVYLAAVLYSGVDMSSQFPLLFNNLFFLICFVVLTAIQCWFETRSRKKSFRLQLKERQAVEYLEQEAENLEKEMTRRAEQHQRTENHYRQLFDYLIDDVVLVEKNGRILYASSSFYSHFGLVRGDAINLLDLVPDHARGEMQDNLLDAVGRGKVVTGFQTEFVFGDDRVVAVEINGNILKRQGRTIGLQLIIRDISDRIVMEQEIRKGLYLRKQTETAAIMALARLSEHRDVTTDNHLERVREYSRVIAETLAGRSEYRHRLSSSRLEDLVMASVLHDIGKVGIPDTILFAVRKPGDGEEMLIRQHTIFGGDVIKSMEKSEETDSGFLSFARNIAYFHHECWDGSGYPFGLKGDDIPIEARIVSLADFYETLTMATDPAGQLTHAQALQVIIQEAGRRFDPDIVDAFVSREQEFVEIFNRLVGDSVVRA